MVPQDPAPAAPTVKDSRGPHDHRINGSTFFVLLLPDAQLLSHSDNDPLHGQSDPVGAGRKPEVMPRKIFTLAQRPDLAPYVRRIPPSMLPEFMLHDAVAERHWPLLFTSFADFQIALCDETETVIAAGHTIPIVWDGTVAGLPAGWDTALERGVHDHAYQRQPTTLCALLAVVAPDHQGQGLSSQILRGMRTIAAKHGFKALVAPVRPTLKSRYPLTPMDRYVRWQRADGTPFDPWLRTHAKLGAELLRIAPQSMVITGTVAEWEAWTAMRFPESGAYVVSGALQPVNIDCERNLGRYEDPNVWMRHAIGA